MPFDSTEHDLQLLQKTLKSLTVRAGFPIAFGGLAARDGAPLTAFVGTRGQTLNGLLIEPGQGLGGRAIAERKPVIAARYRHATSITHRYDREVLAEHIEVLLAIPVLVDGTIRAVIYGAHRTPTPLGDPIVRLSLGLATALAWEYSVNDEVERRLALRDVGQRPAMAIEAALTSLSARELDVLGQVAMGKRNRLIASQLQLAESTVKSYLSSAMNKLEVTSRYEAVVVARRQGLVP